MATDDAAPKSVGAPSLISIAVTVGITLWALNDVSIHCLIDIPTMLLLLFAVFPFGEYYSRLFLLSTYSQGQSSKISMPHWRWLVLPVASILVFTAVFSAWPMHLRFLVSKPSFEVAIGQELQGDPIETPCWIGAIWVEYIGPGAEGVTHFCTGRAVTDEVGITYDQTNPPSRPSYVWLAHNWYGGTIH